MSLPVRFINAATSELEDAARWYEERHAGLGLAFLAAVDEAVASIAEWPYIAPRLEGVSEGVDVRGAPLARFPYYVAYVVVGEAIVVVAMAHERRRPLYWSRRSTRQSED